MPRRTNYGFQKRQKELKRQQKKNEKAAKKKAKKEMGAGGESSGVTPTNEDQSSVRSPRPAADETAPKADDGK